MAYKYTGDLPVKEIIVPVKNELSQNNTLIVHAPPGAGKSTILPLTLLSTDWFDGKKIIILEPRRLAVRSIATRMAELLNESVGETVGYRIRFESKISNKTKIEVITEGILTRMLQQDNELKDVGIVIFDEFHERSIHADLALALCRESQQVLRNSLRILVMSATLNIPQLTEVLNAPCISCEGRQFSVDIHYTDDTDLMLLPLQTARLIKNAFSETKGDILVFLPGEGEIRKCEEYLRNEKMACMIHPLYGMLPRGKQIAAIMPDKQGRRKIVLATSIAETSLTIEGITVVVDCGYTRKLQFNSNSGLSSLVTVRVSLDSAEQRAGRAGRLAPGICYRMWTKATHECLHKHRNPEITDADLTPLLLELYKWGVHDINDLDWLTLPPKGNVEYALQTLELLDAIKDNKITNHGIDIAQYPCHPRIAHMLLWAEAESDLAQACDIAAILEERDPLPRDTGVDLNLRLDALRKQRAVLRLSKQMLRIEKIAASYRNMFDCEVNNSPVDPYETGILLTKAYPERIACAVPGNNAMFRLANGRYAVIGHKDDLAYESWLAVAHLYANDSKGTIFLASPLNPKDLVDQVHETEVAEWNSDAGCLNFSKDLRIGAIVLQSKPMQNISQDKMHRVLTETIAREGEKLLIFDKEVKNWQNRVLSLRIWNPEENWPDVSTETLLKNNAEWLSPYLGAIRKAADFKSLNIKEILHYSLSPDLQEKLIHWAPEKYKVPSGASFKIRYSANGTQPILSVKIQDAFGITETPAINNGKTKLLMQLLSPGFKPVQLTADMNHFWKETYFEIRKELKGRYPKHQWPDKPM